MASHDREHFGSRRAVIYAMAGSAIGLGNIWRFPYMVGEHGGSAFIILYVLSTVLISLPIFISEVTVGRRSRKSAYGAMSSLRPGNPVWKAFGVLGIVIPTFIACYYSVIGGWSLDFLVKSLTGEFVKADPSSVDSIFTGFVSTGWGPVVFHLLFMGISALIVAGGVKSGIEKFSKVTIPILFVLIVLMAAYSVFLPGAGAGVKYLLRPDFSCLTPRDFAFAMGQSFFSLSIGAGALITYGSYVHSKENIIVSSCGTAGFDLLFAILAGFAIMPAVFAAGMEPSCGPGLVYQGIPYIFATIGKNLPVVSSVVSVIFFFTLVVAAMTSIVSLLEVGVSFLVERFGMGRRKACLILASVCGGIGCICALSGRALDVFDWTSSNILMPSMAFAVLIFVGFALKKEDFRDEITNSGTLRGASRIFPLLHFLVRWVAPVFVIILFVANFIL